MRVWRIMVGLLVGGITFAVWHQMCEPCIGIDEITLGAGVSLVAGAFAWRHLS